MILQSRFSICLSVFLALASIDAAVAQEVSADIVEATTGDWLIASEDGSPGCHLTLEKDRTIGGYSLKEGKPCAAPWHDEVQSWDFTGPGIELRDATRKTLIGFEEQEGGPWRTPLDVSPKVYFIQDPGSMDRIPTEKTSLGSWILTDRKGKPLCHLTLLDKAFAGSEDAKSLELSKDCAPSVRKTKAEAWQISEINLVIIGGEDWVYTMLPEAGGGFVSDDKKLHLKRDAS
jgi:hypothetical protein